MAKRAMMATGNRDLLKRIWTSSVSSWLGSAILAFALALAAYRATGAHEPLENSVWLAITGGYAGAPMPSPWNWAVGVPCVAYTATGLAVLGSTLLIILRGLVRTARRPL